MIVLEIFILLFVVMDPFGSMLLVNSLLSHYEMEQRRKIFLRESIISMIILLLASLVGGMLMKILSLEISSLQVTGGVVLFMISIKMVYLESSKASKAEELSDPFIVPIAMPIIAGPSAIATVILFSEKNPVGSVLVAILLACLLTSFILFFSPFMIKWLGGRGLKAMERLMGILLMTVSVQMVLDGMKEYFRNHLDF